MLSHLCQGRGLKRRERPNALSCSRARSCARYTNIQYRIIKIRYSNAVQKALASVQCTPHVMSLTSTIVLSLLKYNVTKLWRLINSRRTPSFLLKTRLVTAFLTFLTCLLDTSALLQMHTYLMCTILVLHICIL